MKKVKAFLYVFKQSISSFSYYKDILETDFSFSIKYLAVLALLATLISAGSITIKEGPKLVKSIGEQKGTVLGTYPDDLEITFSNSEWKINQTEPYVIMMPEFLKAEGAQVPNNLIVFNNNGTLNDFENANTLMLLNKSNLLVKSEGKIEVTPLKDIPDGTFNKQMFVTYAEKVLDLAKYIPLVIFITTSIGFFFAYFVFRLVYLLFVAIALWVVNIFIKPDVEFKHLYRIGLHAMTIPVVIEVLFLVAGVPTIGIPWFLILNIVLGAMVIAKALQIDD